MTKEEFIVWRQSQLTIEFFNMLEKQKDNIDASLLEVENPQHDAIRFNYLLGQRTALKHTINYTPQDDTEGV